MHGVPGLEYISGTSYGLSFHSNELLHGFPSPGNLQQSSQAFVFGSLAVGMHWHDSNPYAKQIDPVHSPMKQTNSLLQMVLFGLFTDGGQ